MFVKWDRIASTFSQRCGGLCLLIACIVAAQGCGGSNNPVPVKVRGVVKYNGKPLSNGSVMFNPTDPQSGRMAQGTIDKDGAFVLSTYKTGDGALEGSYLVSVTSSLPGTEVLTKDKGTGIGGKSAIPERFSDPKTSKLEQTVVAGDPDEVLVLELKD